MTQQVNSLKHLLFEKQFTFDPVTFKGYFSSHKYLFLLFILYFFIRIYNLTVLPIFTDEALYLHWGWMELQSKDWFISLYDGKQPLLTWAFAYAQLLFTDPLYAGRFVSLLTGVVTLIGIFRIGTKFFTEKFALIAGSFYIMLSIFVFYDRMALMESSISAVGIWACYFFLSLVKKPNIYTAVLLGVTLGIGLFDKSNAGIFLVTAVFLGCLVGFTSKNWKERRYLFLLLALSLVVCVIVLLPLLMQKDVYTIVVYNSRYAYPLSQVVSHFFPIITKNIPATFFLLWGYLTPVPFLLSIVGIIFFLRSKEAYATLLVGWFVIPILFFILLTTNPIDRYIVSFLPVTTFFCTSALLLCLKKITKPIYRIALCFVTFFIPVVLTFFLLSSPVTYFSLLHIVTPAVDGAYTQIPSGYGIPETRDYLLEQAKENEIVIFVPVGSGNPEDAIYDYLGERNTHTITVLSTSPTLACAQPQTYFTKSYFVSEGDSIDISCMKSVKKFYRPLGNTFVGVYQLVHN